MLIGFLAKVINIRMVGLLVREKNSIETCLAEGGYYSFLMIQAVVVLGCGCCQKHRHTLVGSVRLRAHITEYK